MKQRILTVARAIGRRLLTLVLTLFYVAPLLAQPLDFSVKLPAPNGWAAADIIAPLGDRLIIPAADLGLPPGTDVNSFSYGTDEIEPLGPFNWVHLAYSVTRESQGVAGPVFVEGNGNGNGGDTFHLTYVRAQVGNLVFFASTPPTRLLDATLRKLTAKGAGQVETELDGLSLNLGNNYPVYFTIEGPNAADIFMVTSPGGPPQLFANAAALGLLPTDTIDALGIRGAGGVPPLTLGNGVVVWVSLRGRAPAQSTGPEDAIYQVFPGPAMLAVPGARLDVRFGDEIDAVAGLDPGPIDPPILIANVAPREGVMLLVAGVTGATYTIQKTSSLTAPEWVNWKTAVAVDRRVEAFDPEFASSATFYRARREP